jgi:hypothetical protein
MILLEVDKLDNIHFSSYNDYVIFGKKKSVILCPKFHIIPNILYFTQTFHVLFEQSIFCIFLCDGINHLQGITKFSIHIHGLSFSL